MTGMERQRLAAISRALKVVEGYQAFNPSDEDVAQRFLIALRAEGWAVMQPVGGAR